MCVLFSIQGLYDWSNVLYWWSWVGSLQGGRDSLLSILHPKFTREELGQECVSEIGEGGGLVEARMNAVQRSIERACGLILNSDWRCQNLDLPEFTLAYSRHRSATRAIFHFHLTAWRFQPEV